MANWKRNLSFAGAGLLAASLGTPASAAEPMTAESYNQGLSWNIEQLKGLSSGRLSPAGGSLEGGGSLGKTSSDMATPLANLPAKNGYYTMSGWDKTSYINGGFSSSWSVSNGGTKYAMSSGRSEANFVPTSYTPSSRQLITHFGYHGISFTVSTPLGVSGSGWHKATNYETNLGSGGRYIAQDYGGIRANGTIYSIDQHISVKMRTGSTDRFLEVH